MDEKRCDAPAAAAEGVACPVVERPVRTCRVCGCTDEDCSQCIAKTGASCWWVEDDLCSACIDDGDDDDDDE